MWKSWIAMLCVALVAFVTLEQVSAAHAATDPCLSVSASSVGESAPANVTADADQDDVGSPIEQQQHHCCGAHTSSTPPHAHASAPLQLAEMRVAVRNNDPALDNAPFGLERPPRITAIV